MPALTFTADCGCKISNYLQLRNPAYPNTKPAYYLVTNKTEARLVLCDKHKAEVASGDG